VEGRGSRVRGSGVVSTSLHVAYHFRSPRSAEALMEAATMAPALSAEAAAAEAVAEAKAAKRREITAKVAELRAQQDKAEAGLIHVHFST